MPWPAYFSFRLHLYTDCASNIKKCAIVKLDLYSIQMCSCQMQYCVIVKNSAQMSISIRLQPPPPPTPRSYNAHKYM